MLIVASVMAWVTLTAVIVGWCVVVGRQVRTADYLRLARTKRVVGAIVRARVRQGRRYVVISAGTRYEPVLRPRPQGARRPRPRRSR